MLSHESDMSQKILLETRKTGLFRFIDSDDRQGRRRHSTRELLLQPSDVWMEDRQGPQQPKGLKQWIIDLIYEKKEK
jgi:hypothetical protein